MTRPTYRMILLVVGVVAYVLLCRGLYLFLEMDRCLDDGGVIDAQTGACEDSRSGVAHFFEEAAPLRAWILLFVLPMVPTLIVVALTRAVLRPWAPPAV
jgi:hypothetical protein